MSEKDKKYRPRRFRDSEERADSKTENKLKNSRSAKKYMVDHSEEYASEPVSGQEKAPSVKIPTRVNISSVGTQSKNAPAKKSPRTADEIIAEITRENVERAEAEAREKAEKASAAAEKSVETETPAPSEPETEPAEKPAETANAEKEPVREQADPVADETGTDDKSEVSPEPKKPAIEVTPAETVSDIEDSLPEIEPDTDIIEENEAPEKPGIGDDTSEKAGAVSADESFDYVVPQRKKHKKHHSGSDSAKTAVALDSDEAYDDDYVFGSDNPDYYTKKKSKKKKKKSKLKTVLISVLCVILALVIGIVGTFFVMREIGRSKMHDYNKIEIEAPDKDESGNIIDTLDATGRVINYGGVSYEFNDNVISIAFIGADEGSGQDEGMMMGDAIYVLTVDAKSGDTKILGISRDTMADVDVYSNEGKFIDTEKLQMAYAHAYRSDTVTGGQNTITSISRLFYGLPMKNYFAINMDALTTLNDAIGGVTLTSSITFVSPEDGRTISEGETVTLHGKEADKYVRTRDMTQLESNNDRMQRQQEYIRAFLSQIFPAVKNDISVVSKLYSAITDNSETSLDITKMTYIASTAVSHLNSASDIQYVNLKGKIVEGKHAEMYVSNEDTIRTMLDIFYKPITFSSAKETSAEETKVPEETDKSAPTKISGEAPTA